MNTVNLIGRLVRDPDTKYPQTDQQLAVTHYTLAVNRWVKNKNEVDFIRCVAFGKAAEFAESYFYKGVKVALSGRIATGSYEDKDGKKIYTTEVVVENQEFAESRKSADTSGKAASM